MRLKIVCSLNSRPRAVACQPLLLFAVATCLRFGFNSGERIGRFASDHGRDATTMLVCVRVVAKNAVGAWLGGYYVKEQG